MTPISYYSTNRSAAAVNFRQAILQGIAPDGGLYMPSGIPVLTAKELNSLSDKSYPEIAFMVLWKFLEGEIDKETLFTFCREAYNFDVPLERVSEKLHIIRLDRGPTASFKDFAARLMARLFNYFLEKEDKDITILTATSGDTGSAVASAYAGLGRIRVVILYPEKEVSELQRRQMTTIGGNIKILAVDGKFDKCQALVKKAFSDRDLNSINFSSANSINIGRLLPQAVYYFYAWSRIAQEGESIIYSVPSGNFGNLCGGLLAKRMGLPVKRFIVAVNENDEFPRFLDSGIYEKVEPSRNCISSAMNVGHPSNLARLADFYGGSMNENGVILRMPEMMKVKKDILSYTISDLATKNIIKDVHKEYGIVLEPHGAVAWGGVDLYRNNSELTVPTILLETAHPAKFPDIVYECTGVLPQIPASLLGLSDKKEGYEKIESDYSAFKKYLKKG